MATVKATELKGVQEGIGATYGEKGEKSIWTRTTGEGHDKRQCTVQLTYLPMVSLA
ncbi:unnamed protein product [Porites evermanni]|uniref:Uncharacterized protein n=1 Tax=Porites evermanni TaxID=104178 RepID=A0ABN8PTD1_9CNID|nr:unnamed protein product [Porites evermanni]